MAPHRSVEIERKYDIGETATVPSLQDLPGVERVEKPVEQHLDATYFDTDDLTLATRGLTLRRRAGGDDPGWHLKIPAGPEGGRMEQHHEVGSDPEAVPEALLQLLRVHVRDHAILPVARLQTTRIVHRLRGPEEQILAEVCDDRVEATRLVNVPAALSWREWEVELAGGPPSLLDAVQTLLAAAGARPAKHPSKLARTLGPGCSAKKASGAPRQHRKGPTAAVLLACLHGQVRALSEQDPRVRQDEPDALHRMRIATRRLRSILATYRTLLDPEVVSGLRQELKWLAGVLGPARDAQVMRKRLGALVAAEPADLVLGPVSRRVQEELGADHHAARLHTKEALDGQRYFRILDGLDALLAAPPLTETASAPARRIVPRLISNEHKRLLRAVRSARRAPAEASRDAALHEVRKSAKRLRYAAETAAPLYRKRAVRLARRAKKLQTVLGDHQDSVVSRDLLRRIGVQAHLEGENGFSYGRLHALEQSRATNSRAKFDRVWKRLPPPSLKK